MIESVSIASVSAPIKKQNLPIASSPVKQNKENRVGAYTDSFVKHAKKSTPVLLILTGVWTAIDKGSKNIPIKKSLVNNITDFFLPVLVASSALLAGIENKKTSENKK